MSPVLTPIRKILIANRGEIACRVIRTARRMGIRTVAVYSEADAQALHVREADEAVPIGPAPSAQSYLDIERIVAAIRATGADAVHPGYGFLSENPDFARRLESEGVTFIGPPVRAVEAMGDKITSKRLAAEAGVSTVPGHMGLIEDAAEAVRIAEEIGYPVMIKASAGGGGKGMRIAWNAAEAREGFQAARNEARTAFGDERIFLEKFVDQPRHIEIQVLGDRHGTVIHLGERECSIQRRNQKVVEEAPSPFLDEATRQAMGAEAVALARAVGYHSAGTVEFIVDGSRRFYFLEMNTRLQVEHPVTELVTGIDLVEEMIRVAQGEPLRLAQDDVRMTGWAVESRLYAEDPMRNFLPSIGRLSRYRPPAEGQAEDGTVIRNDTGVFEGGQISIHYDPMIAKLCAFAPDRAGAIDAMARALDDFELEGIGHNLPFLSALMRHPRFRAGELTTGFIAEEWPDGFHGAEPTGEEARVLAAVAAFVHLTDERRKAGISGALAHHTRRIGAEHVVALMGVKGAGERESWPVRADWREGGLALAFAEGTATEVCSNWTPGDAHGAFLVGGERFGVKVARAQGAWRLRLRGVDRLYRVVSPRVFDLMRLMPEKQPADTSKQLLCPMPGVVTQVLVREGESVEAGQPLATVEAMKMENMLRAERRGTVSAVKAAPGQSLGVDDVILEFA